MADTPSSPKSTIQKSLNKTIDRIKSVANGKHSRSSSEPLSPRSKDNPAVVNFLNSTVGDRFSYKQLRRLNRRQDTRESNENDERWTIETGKRRYDVNRYTDIVPYDATRVILESGLDGKNCAKDDYINASYVYTPKHTRRYIAAQGPLENTVDQFWRMVWDNISTTQADSMSTIIMLTQVTENDIEKCAHYWPEQVDGNFEIPFRDRQSEKTLVVKLASQQKVPEADCTVSTIELYARDPNQRQETPVYQVRHLLYNGWRDMSVPLSTNTFLNYFQLFHKYHTSEALPIVHCTAGVGRTGVFIALDYLLTAVPHMTSEEILNDPVFETVDELRNWRGSMVIKSSQLEYIYTLFRETVLTDETSLEGQTQ
jgi:protein-tyrosine phosphatase